MQPKWVIEGVEFYTPDDVKNLKDMSDFVIHKWDVDTELSPCYADVVQKAVSLKKHKAVIFPYYSKTDKPNAQSEEDSSSSSTRT